MYTIYTIYAKTKGIAKTMLKKKNILGRFTFPDFETFKELHQCDAGEKRATQVNRTEQRGQK